MEAGLITYLVLYSSLFAGVITIWNTRLYQTALSLLMFSSISSLGYSRDVLGTIVYGSLLALLPAYLFYVEHAPSLYKSREDKSIGDMVVGGLMSLFIALIFKKTGVGWCLSLLMGYWLLYVLVVTTYRKNRKAFYYAKVPFVLLSFGTIDGKVWLSKLAPPLCNGLRGTLYPMAQARPARNDEGTVDKLRWKPERERG